MMNAAQKLRVIDNLCHQSSALVVLAGLAPDEVAEIYLDLALALALRSGVSPLECAVTLRAMATRLEELESGGPAAGPETN